MFDGLYLLSGIVGLLWENLSFIVGMEGYNGEECLLRNSDLAHEF